MSKPPLLGKLRYPLRPYAYNFRDCSVDECIGIMRSRVLLLIERSYERAKRDVEILCQ